MSEQSSDAAQTSTLQSTLLQAYLMIEELEAKLAAASNVQREPIAIVGMGCRFPGAADPAAFWQLLQNGVDATRPLGDRFDMATYYDADPAAPGKMYVERAGLLDEIAEFDPLFFGISPREALAMMPEQRLLLEVAWEALEGAGINPHALRNSKTGIFIGHESTEGDYLPSFAETPDELFPYIDNGNSVSILAGRLAHFLGVHGPTLVTSTACSSALVATQSAVQSLRVGDCRAAIVGGIQLHVAPRSFILGTKSGLLAADGRCKTFAASADGYGRGEGCGVLILKRLRDAVADGDPVLALIHGAAINHDGPSAGLTVPNGTAQEQLMRQALQAANINPDGISYIEANGIGTPLGDSIEIEALGRLFGERSTPLLVGSVKTNIGHLEAASGMAAVIKVVLSLQHATIPAHLHFAVPNPDISWDELPIEIPTATVPWPAADATETRGRLAGVNSFGVSGTNAHLILGEAPVQIPEQAPIERPCHLLTLSARSEDALSALAERYVEYLGQQTDDTFPDIAFTANHGRAHFPHRLAVIAADHSEAHDQLTQWIAGEDGATICHGIAAVERTPTIAFLFPDNLTDDSTAVVNLGRELYATQPTFRSTIERCDALYRAHVGEPLLDFLYPGKSEEGVETGDWRLETEDLATRGIPWGAQPALFALEYALAMLWQSWGIEADLILGYGVGEIAAACVAGIFSVEDGLQLATARGRVLQHSLSAGEAQKQAEPLFNEVTEVAKAITYHAPRIPVIATGTDLQTESPLTDWHYWVRRIQEGERFAERATMPKDSAIDICMEIGPQSITSNRHERRVNGNNSRTAPGDTACSLPGLSKEQRTWQWLLTTLGELYVRGVAIDWKAVDQDYANNKVTLPTYPFQRQRYWLERRDVFVTPMQDHNGQSPQRQQHADSPVHREPGVPLAAQLASATPEEWHPLIVTYLQELAARILQLDNSMSLNPHETLISWGLDSVTALELRNQVQMALPAVTLAVTTFIDASLMQIATLIEEQYLHAQLTASDSPAAQLSSDTIDEESGTATEGLAEELVEELIL